jgi:hypothetical protein
MKITYTPNPLRTIVELDEHEQEIFKLKIKISELEEAMGSASLYLDPKNAGWIMNKSPRRPDGHTLESLIEEVRKDYLDMDYFYTDETPSGIDKRVQELFEHYIEELKGSHIGDCTCFAMSCSKCHAESKLGIDTIKGLGKHPGHKIQSAFSYKEGDVWKERSLDEALAILGGYDPKQTDPDTDAAWAKVGGFEAHIPRWKAEAKAAYDWLLAYRNEHCPSGDAEDTRH